MLDEYERDEALLHFQRGAVLERAHRVHEAVEEYRQAIARYPHLREAHDALGFYYQRYGQLAKAADEFRVVANLEDDFLSHFNLGYVLLDIEQPGTALKTFLRCLDFIPNDPATHYEVASLRYQRGEYAEALNHIQIALQTYTEDWEIFRLRGRCMLQLERYAEASEAFETSRRYATRPAAISDLGQLLAAVERHQAHGSGSSLKDRHYADYGVAHLGSAQDDGLHLDVAAEYHFTYPDIATTLRRLITLATPDCWDCTSVVALDRLARPVASALATMFGLPLRESSQLQRDVRPLMIMAIGREPELLDVAAEQNQGRGISFCLGLNWLRRSPKLPDLTGVAVQGACSVPWEPELRRLRALGAPTEQIDRCLSNAAYQIIAASNDLIADPTLAAQMAYYREERILLRFAR